MKPTYEIMSELKVAKSKFNSMIEETEGEINECVQQVLDDIDNLNIEAIDKIHAINWVYDQISERASAINGVYQYHQEKSQLYKSKIVTIENNEDRLKSKIIDLMGELNIASIDFDHKNIKVLHSKSLVIEDLDLALCNIPNDYKRIKQEVDKTALKAHILNTGVSYEGVSVQEKPYLKGL